MTDELPPSNHQSVIEDDPDGFYSWSLERAQHGHVEDAKELLHGFLSHLIYKTPLYEPIATYLSLAFHRYLRGECAIDQALLLRKKKGRKAGTSSFQPQVVLARVYLKMRRDGMKKEAAKAAVAAQLPTDKSTIEKYDQEWNLVGDLDIETLELLASLDVRKTR